jgi:hypothetical protein
LSRRHAIRGEERDFGRNAVSVRALIETSTRRRS